VHALRAALNGDTAVTLDIAALEMAVLERPGVDVMFYLDALDSIAAEVATRLGPNADGSKFIRILNQHLFDELHFRGNQDAYYDPQNSCLDQVLDRRTGIPISLSVVYIELGRRLGRPVHGVGLPGHFVVAYDDGDYSTYIDPFHGGKLMSEQDCRNVAREITGVEISASALEPVGVRYILVRMLNNLREAYFRAKLYEKAVTVLDLLLEAFPQDPGYLKTRGVARLHLREFSAARADLEKYLKLAPEAEDRSDVVQQLEAIHRWLGRLN
jgi:regulator of sirC expression with transglutaminase-like and TPR domain